MIDQLVKEITNLQSKTDRLIDLLNVETHDKIVTIKVGKYAGYKAQISGVSISHHSDIRYLCYVLGKKNGTILNSDGETRSYRLASEFTFD